jgi:hypothetical protein
MSPAGPVEKRPPQVAWAALVWAGLAMMRRMVDWKFKIPKSQIPTKSQYSNIQISKMNMQKG